MSNDCYSEIIEEKEKGIFKVYNKNKKEMYEYVLNKNVYDEIDSRHFLNNQLSKIFLRSSPNEKFEIVHLLKPIFYNGRQYT